MIRTVTVRTPRAHRKGSDRAERRARQAAAAERRNRFVRLAADHARPTPAATSGPKPTAMPAPAPDTHTLTTSGGGDAWHGTCSCGQWATSRAMKREASVKGAHTRHVNNADTSADTSPATTAA